MAKIIEVDEQNTSDSVQSTPRAVIAVFPYIVRQIYPHISINEPQDGLTYQDYLNLRNKCIIISDDVISVAVSTAKGNPNHTLQATLAPLGTSKVRKTGETSTSTSDNNIVDYLQRMAPGDWIMCWIVKGTEQQKDLIKKLRAQDSRVNGFDSGLKFIGQVMNINESFRTSTNGMKSKRFTVSAAGFNQYNSQIFYSPFIGAKANTPTGAAVFINTFYKNLEQDVVSKVYDKREGGPLNIQKQLKVLHQTLLGPGPGNGNENEKIRSTNGAFGVPAEVAKVLGRRKENGKFTTYADICTVILGVQKFSEKEEEFGGGALGPSYFELADPATQNDGNKYGAYYEPPEALNNLFLKGRKALAVSPTMGGTVYSMLQQVSNSAINEMYFTLRPEPTKEGNILPTMVCRQLPFADKLIEEIDNFSYTNYFEMPRFRLNPKTVLGYDLSRSEALRLNTVMARMSVVNAKPGGQTFLDGMAVEAGNWAFDANDIKRHGQRFYPVNIDQAVITLNETDNFTTVRKYAAFVTSVIANQHLKYTGNVQTVGIHAPICVGENCEFNDIVFHIEGVAHTYQVSEGGLPSFRTTLSLSHGVHKNGKLDALNDAHAYELFDQMCGGIIKEGQFPTEFGGPSGAEPTMSSGDIGDETQRAAPETSNPLWTQHKGLGPLR
jgi:hypothetical protein